jgi:hypothetical protein
MNPLLRVMLGALFAAQAAPADPLIAENAIVQTELPAKFPGWAAPARVGLIARTAYTETP